MVTKVRVREWLVGEEGEDLAEYAVLVLLIAITAIAGVGLLGEAVLDLYRRIVAVLLAL